MDAWVVVSSAQNVKTSFENNKWGVSTRLKGVWEKVAKGDLLIFYVTSPVRGIVGVAFVEGKIEEHTTLWQDELVVGRALYPYRILFKPIFILEKEKWESNKITIKDLKVSVQAGINHLKNEDAINKLLERISKSWGIKIKANNT
jgi:predicted RNA-binding protein